MTHHRKGGGQLRVQARTIQHWSLPALLLAGKPTSPTSLAEVGGLLTKQLRQAIANGCPRVQTLRQGIKKIEKAALEFAGVFGRLELGLKSRVEFFDENIPVL